MNVVARFAPVALTLAGLGVLLSSWACGPIIVAPHAPVATPMPPPPERLPELEPAAGKVFTYRTTVTKIEGSTWYDLRTATHVFTVKAFDGQTLTYDVTTTPTQGEPTTRTGASVPRKHGVFWTLDTPSPVEKDITAYPTYDLTLEPFGRMLIRRIDVATGNYFFFQGIPVSVYDAATKSVTTLEAVR